MTKLHPAQLADLSPLAEWHDDDGDALFTGWPIVEPPYVGTPGDSDWPFGASADLWWCRLPGVFRHGIKGSDGDTQRLAEAFACIQGCATAVTGRECPPVNEGNMHRVADEVLAAAKTLRSVLRLVEDESRAENGTLRLALSKVAKAVGGGADPERCSAEFMSYIPSEVDAALAALRAENAKLRAKLDAIAAAKVEVLGWAPLITCRWRSDTFAEALKLAPEAVGRAFLAALDAASDSKAGEAKQ